MNMTTNTVLEQEKVDISLWWYSLSQEWKCAFMQTCFQDYKGSTPTKEMLESLFEREVFRFVGPSAPFPNMDFELKDLSGLKGFGNIKILVVTNHQIKSIEAIADCKEMTHLFLQDNQIQDIAAIENFINIVELFIQNNKVKSIEPIRQLTKLKRFLCFDNLIENLEGLTEAHAEVLKDFYCLPNEKLSLREVVKTEKELYIACKSC